MKKIILSFIMFLTVINNTMADVRVTRGGDAFEGTSWTAVVIDGKVRAGEKSQTPRIVLYPGTARNTLFGGVQLTASVFLGDRFVCTSVKSKSTRVKARIGNKQLTPAHIKFADSNSGHYFNQTFTKKGISAILDGKEFAFKYTDTCGTTQITTFDNTNITAEAKVVLEDLLKKMQK